MTSKQIEKVKELAAQAKEESRKGTPESIERSITLLHQAGMITSEIVREAAADQDVAQMMAETGLLDQLNWLMKASENFKDAVQAASD